MQSFTEEQKEQYRLHKMSFAYDRARIAREIISEEYHKAHPRSRRRPKDGIMTCGLPTVHGDIKVYMDEKGHEYHSKNSCDSWACPICAPKLANRRAQDIERAITAAEEKGYTQVFVTLTIPHRKSHTTAHVIDLLNASYNKLLQSCQVRAIKKAYNFIGAIKCLDYTLTQNGTHAHLHVIMMFDCGIDALDLSVMISPKLVNAWCRIVDRICKKKPSEEHGLHISPIELGVSEGEDATRIAHYAAKALSIYCSEKDKDGCKKSNSLNPFDLLKKDATPDERALFYDFYKGQRGRKHILFSRGLRETLGISEPSKGAGEKKAKVVAAIDYVHGIWLSVEERRAEFERRLNNGIDAALRWLEKQTPKLGSMLISRLVDADSDKEHNHGGSRPHARESNQPKAGIRKKLSGLGAALKEAGYCMPPNRVNALDYSPPPRTYIIAGVPNDLDDDANFWF